MYNILLVIGMEDVGIVGFYIGCFRVCFGIEINFSVLGFNIVISYFFFILEFNIDFGSFFWRLFFDVCWGLGFFYNEILIFLYKVF